MQNPVLPQETTPASQKVGLRPIVCTWAALQYSTKRLREGLALFLGWPRMTTYLSNLVLGRQAIMLKAYTTKAQAEQSLVL